MSNDERRIMEHATAWHHKNRLYRNHYACGPDADAWHVIQALCRRGLMRVARPPTDWLGGMSVFQVTDHGVAELEKKP